MRDKLLDPSSPHQLNTSVPETKLRPNKHNSNGEKRSTPTEKCSITFNISSKKPSQITTNTHARTIRLKAHDRLLKAARASGSLNLSNRNLKNVPDEVYQSLDSVGEDEKWWEIIAVELQKLILAHNSIECLKEDLRNLTQLTVLNVSNNKLSELPAALGELTMLKSLDVSSNLLQNLLEAIGLATALVKLDCSSNQLKELPGSLGRCVDLSELKASNNCITSLPEDLARC